MSLVVVGVGCRVIGGVGSLHVAAWIDRGQEVGVAVICVGGHVAEGVGLTGLPVVGVVGVGGGVAIGVGLACLVAGCVVAVVRDWRGQRAGAVRVGLSRRGEFVEAVV